MFYMAKNKNSDRGRCRFVSAVYRQALFSCLCGICWEFVPCWVKSGESSCLCNDDRVVAIFSGNCSQAKTNQSSSHGWNNLRTIPEWNKMQLLHVQGSTLNIAPNVLLKLFFIYQEACFPHIFYQPEARMHRHICHTAPQV